MYMYMYERFHRTRSLDYECAPRVIVKSAQYSNRTVPFPINQQATPRHFYVPRRRVRFRPNKTCPDAVNSDSRV